jgi:hypothetical protein
MKSVCQEKGCTQLENPKNCFNFLPFADIKQSKPYCNEKREYFFDGKGNFLFILNSSLKCKIIYKIFGVRGKSDRESERREKTESNFNPIEHKIAFK